MRRSRRRPSPALVVAVLALVAALAGTAVAGPTATTSINKKKTKKISRKQAKKQIRKRAVEQEDLLFATVAPSNANATIVRSQGATAVTKVANGFFAVAFERDVTDCTWLATYGRPDNTGVNAHWATVRGRGSPQEVGVVLRNANGVQTDGGNGFHVQAVCPS